MHVGDLNHNKQTLQVFFKEIFVFCPVSERNMSSKRKADKDEASSSDDSDSEVRNCLHFMSLFSHLSRCVQVTHVVIIPDKEENCKERSQKEGERIGK